MQNPHELLVEIDSLKERNKILEQENNFLREQFKLAKARQFGASSERSPDQFDWLFNEAETIEDAEKIAVQEDIITDVAVTESTPVATKKKNGRKPLPKDLPRETRVIDVAAADKVCPCCQGDLHRIGEEKSEQLEYIPASLKVIETLRPKYACRQCEKKQRNYVNCYRPGARETHSEKYGHTQLARAHYWQQIPIRVAALSPGDGVQAIEHRP